MTYKIKRKPRKKESLLSEAWKHTLIYKQFAGKDKKAKKVKKAGFVVNPEKWEKLSPYGKLRYACAVYSAETPEERRKKYKAKPKYDLSKPIGYPKYAYFYGKERADLLAKMNWRERRIAKEREKDIKEIAIASGIMSAGASTMAFYQIPTLVLTTPLNVFGSKRLRRMLKERRFFLREMHKKYEGGKG